MSDYSKYNIIYRLQKWIETVQGQTFLNYAYSWGASVVILGALFKLTHLPGANIMLFIGMGTEVFVFFISAFDRPFDKTADGREIPTKVTKEYLEKGIVSYSNDEEAAAAEEAGASAEQVEAIREGKVSPAGAGASAGGQTIIFTGGVQGQAPSASQQSSQQQNPDAQATSEGEVPAGGSVSVGVAPNYVPQMSAEQAEALNEAQGKYVEELNKLVETLGKVNEQSSRLTRDSEEMENLNRTLTGISRVYEMQLKGASQQIGTIDQINEQTRNMARQIEQLNRIYARMIEAMTVNMNMRSAAPTGGNPVSNVEE